MERKQQFHSLTALKGLFILVIVFHNTLSIHPLFDSIPGSSFITLFGGDLGNSMFFILSGFLLSYGYRERIAGGAVSFRDYLLRRLWKLYPMYLLTNAVSLLIAIVQHGISAINLKKIIFTLLLQIGGGLEGGNPYNSPTWFLSALFVCYISFFFICYYAKKPTQYLCAVVFGIIWGYYLQMADRNIPFCYASTGLGLMNFYIGCFLANITLSRQDFYKKRLWVQAGSICSLLFFFCLMLRYGVEIICGDVAVAFSFLICPMFLYLALADGPCAALLRKKPFVWLGNISLSLFFWHLPLYFAFEMGLTLIVPGTGMQEGSYLLYFLLLLGLSIFSHCILEKKK